MASVTDGIPQLNKNDHAEVLAALQASRRERGIPTPDYDAILAENERLRQSEADRQRCREDDRAQSTGTAVLSRRRAELGITQESAATVGEIAALQAQNAPEYDNKLFTYANIAAELVKRSMAGVSMAYDIAKRYSRTHNGAEILTSAQFCDLLAEYGIQRRRALAYLKEGEGVTWEYVGRARHDQRMKLYRLRALERVQVSLGVNHPGHALKLPVHAYTGNAAHYADFVVGGWLYVYDRASRARQSATFGRSERHIRRMQERAQVKQTAVGVRAAQPANENQALELAAILANDDGVMRHHWRGPKGEYRWQHTNYYHGGIVIDLGLKRAGFINAQAERLSDSPVYEGIAELGFGGATSPAFEEPRIFASAITAHKYQDRHYDHTALYYFGDMPKDRPLPTRVIQGARMTGYQFSYSYATRLGRGGVSGVR